MQPRLSPVKPKTRKALWRLAAACLEALVVLVLLVDAPPAALAARLIPAGSAWTPFGRICEEGDPAPGCSRGQARLPSERELAVRLYPGRLHYRAQSGDTLALVAARFGVPASEILSLQPLPAHGLIDPGQLLVLPAGLPAAEPALRLLPDSEVVYSPSALDFDIAAYLQQAGGALSNHQEYLSSSGWTTAADIVARVALENSINPRLLLALLEQQCACVLGRETAALDNGYSLGVVDYHRKGLYGQLWWAANQLSTGYYGWREGWLGEISLPDGTTVHLAAGSNAGSVAVQTYFASLWRGHDLTAVMGAGNWQQLHPDGFNGDDYRHSIDPVQGFVALYSQMFGDPWSRALAVEPLLQAGLQQPELSLPFEPGRLWAYTSGPHRAWESEGSRAALDFAPAAHRPGCLPTNARVLAVASGIVTRVGPGLIVQDLDSSQPSDGREQTGWSILYMHVDHQDRFRPGDLLQAGDPLGSPSCLGGRSTGTHLHIARKYNGEWIAAGGALPFVLSGWTAHAGEKPYEGVLLKDGHTVVAHPYANYETNIRLPGVEGAPAALVAVNATPTPYWLSEPAPQPEP